MNIFALPESSKRVLAVLSSSQSLGFTQLRKRTGLSERTLRFALARLKERGLVHEVFLIGDTRKKLIRIGDKNEE